MINPAIQELDPVAVHENLLQKRIILIDVREPHEFSEARIRGAFNFPLSTFDPQALPVSDDRPVVLLCGAGKRSLKALELCQAAGAPVIAHMAGGLGAWRRADLPIIAVDPATGQIKGV
jgi:rhodanese-related sulfurtransferase